MTPRSGECGERDEWGEWTGRAVCVAGLGISGAAAARVLAERGARVTVVDARDDHATRERAARLEARGVAVRLGDGDTLPAGIELVVTSPGWRPDASLLATAAAAGVEVLGEVELAWRLRAGGHDDEAGQNGAGQNGAGQNGAPAPWLALTGTNGKTTAVRMLACMLTAAGHRALAVGNVGMPIVEAVTGEGCRRRAGADPLAASPGQRAGEDAEPYDVLAVELSSYQLHWSSSLNPFAAVVLNVAADHLDWHGSIDAYAADKAKIFGPGTIAVANADDPWSMRLAQGALGRARTQAPWRTPRPAAFTLGTPGPGQLGVVDDLIVDRAFIPDPAGKAVTLATLSDVRPFAPHNVANALAAAALARAFGAAPEAVRNGLRAFTPDPHRIAHVASVAGVDYVDDSKATNPHAAAASLGAYRSVVWIAGGLLKGAAVDDLIRSRADRLRGVVLLGADREPIARALARHAPNVPVTTVSGVDTGVMDRVVTEAARLAGPGDTVLLAPAGASFDMFSGYGARGEAFVGAVRRLAESAGAGGRYPGDEFDDKPGRAVLSRDERGHDEPGHDEPGHDEPGGDGRR